MHYSGPGGRNKNRKLPLVSTRYRGIKFGELDMTLKPEQEDEVRLQVIEKFGEESVKQLDLLFFEFHDIRGGCKDNFDFLYKVREKHGEQGEQVVAALLYGMKMGEISREYVYRLEQEQKTGEGKPLPAFGHAE